MKSQQLFQDSRVEHVRTLKAQLAAALERACTAESECAQWQAHFALALAAAQDLTAATARNGRLIILDGWNIQLNSKPRLIDTVVTRANAQPQNNYWVVFDGPNENTALNKDNEHVRVTFTGGTGLHRADRLIIDYLHALRLTGGDLTRISIVTDDKDFRKLISNTNANIVSVYEFLHTH